MKRFLCLILSALFLFSASACVCADPHELCETYADQVSWIPGAPQFDLSPSMTTEDLADYRVYACRFSVRAVDVMEMSETVDGGPAVRISFVVEEPIDEEQTRQAFFTFSSLPKGVDPESLLGMKYVSVINLNQTKEEPLFFLPGWTFYLTEDGKLVNACGCRHEEERRNENDPWFGLSIPARLFTGRTEKELVDALPPIPED